MSENRLHRHLNARHISMIAIGGAIGTGIFIASGNALHVAGPGGAILAFSIIGVMVYFLMTSLGEMSALIPVTGSFCDYCTRFVEPAFGFAMSYNYWFNWSITVAVDLSAASFVMKYWFPNVPFIEWSALFFCLITLLNVLSVDLYGETQYWFSAIKVSTIIIFIVVGILMIVGVVGNHAVNFNNWVIGDAPFHNGWLGFISVLLVAGFAFQGTEIFGVTAGEMKDPQKNIPSAVKKVFWRILLFYILSMAIISFIIPYTDKSLINSDTANIALSPFTIVFKEAGFKFAASIVNFVILTGVLSACNSSMYTATRTLWHIANEGNAPAVLAKTNKHGVPINALLITSIVGATVFLSSIFGSGHIFIWLISISSLSGFIAWFGIALSHLRFRRAYVAQNKGVSGLPYVAKLFPFGPILALVLCSLIIVGQQFDFFVKGDFNLGNIIGTYIGIPIFLILYLGYKFYRGSKIVKLSECRFDYLM